MSSHVADVDRGVDVAVPDPMLLPLIEVAADVLRELEHRRRAARRCVRSTASTAGACSPGPRPVSCGGRCWPTSRSASAWSNGSSPRPEVGPCSRRGRLEQRGADGGRGRRVRRPRALRVGALGRAAGGLRVRARDRSGARRADARPPARDRRRARAPRRSAPRSKRRAGAPRPRASRPTPRSRAPSRSCRRNAPRRRTREDDAIARGRRRAGPGRRACRPSSTRRTPRSTNSRTTRTRASQRAHALEDDLRRVRADTARAPGAGRERGVAARSARRARARPTR